MAVQRGAAHVAEELIALANAHEADLLVVGRRSHPVRPWSVAAGIVHLARMTVGTVPAGSLDAVRSE